MALEASIQSVQEAAKLLPEDKELADALKKITKRRDEVAEHERLTRTPSMATRILSREVSRDGGSPMMEGHYKHA